MARLTDHDVRDAEHAARMEVALLLGRYARRVLEEAKGIIQVEIEEAAKKGDEVDGTAIGRAAAASAAKFYFGGLAGAAPRQVLESGPAASAEA